jgi:hypothetical protein
MEKGTRAKRGEWPRHGVWVDMFSLRQRQKDFHIGATLELIKDIRYATATVNGAPGQVDYFKRSFCLLEAYAALAQKEKSGDSPKLQIFNLSSDEDQIFFESDRFEDFIDSDGARTMHETEQQQIRAFIISKYAEEFDDAEAVTEEELHQMAFRRFDHILLQAVEKSEAQNLTTVFMAVSEFGVFGGASNLSTE